MKSPGIYWIPEYPIQAMRNSQQIEIQVSNNIPQVAQAVANALANQIALLSPSSDQAGETDR